MTMKKGDFVFCKWPAGDVLPVKILSGGTTGYPQIEWEYNDHFSSSSAKSAMRVPSNWLFPLKK